MKRLIECVPNFSEGRDASKVDALVTAMCKVPGVYVLDREMDADHNRCVVTLAGDPGAGAEAAARGGGVGNEIWSRYRIPVYFYEAAAQRPERVNLENIRRGQFEGLREEMKRDHNRLPDIGEPKLHHTGGGGGGG